MFEDDGTIPPILRRVPDAPHWRSFNGAQVSKAHCADNSLDAIAAEGAARGLCAALAVATDGLETPSLAVVLVNPEPVAQAAQIDLYRRAADSWEHLKETERHTWEHYIAIGEAMVAARAEIMRRLGRNDPTGPAYQRDFKAWLVEYRLADMDKGARVRLIALIDALPEVNEMLSGWSDRDRRVRNHPNTIYRAFEKWRIAHGQSGEARTKKPTAATRNEILQENERPSAHIPDIEAACESKTGSATTANAPLEPTEITIESDRSASVEMVSSSPKKMTPRAARRVAERAERKRRKQLDCWVFQIRCACEHYKKVELPTTLTVAERDDAVAQLEASASDLDRLIDTLKVAPVTERDRNHD